MGEQRSAQKKMMGSFNVTEILASSALQIGRIQGAAPVALGIRLSNQGFLGTAAPGYADLALLLEIAMGFGLLVGALLARKQKFQAHGWCQSLVVLLNLGIIAVVMVPSFQNSVSPRIPSKLGKAYVALATAHGVLGGIVECAALYILLAAGTKLLPEKFRLKRYKLWMRTLFAAWWLVLLLGVATYVRWYVPHPFGH